MPNINHEILVWARTSIGLTQEEAAKKLGFNDNKKQSAVERLNNLEIGENSPNRATLLKMSKLYKRSLLTFYLENIPKKGERGKDFRTLPTGYSDRNDALLDALIRNISVRQSIVRSTLEDEEALPLDFVSSINLNSSNVTEVTKKLIDLLEFDINEFASKKGGVNAFKLLRSKVENVGVFVILAGDLGSYHSDIKPNIFRGFASADNIAPFIVINDNDANTAWSFTLLHELVHLCLGETGVSANFSEMKIEKFCNDVASEILFPRNEITKLDITERDHIDDIKKLISKYAQERNLSHTMVAYRIYREHLIDEQQWKSLQKLFYNEWINKKKSKKEAKNDGGPNFYTVRRHRIGKALLKLVSRTINEGLLTPTKAAKVLGVSPRNVSNFVNPIEGV